MEPSRLNEAPTDDADAGRRKRAGRAAGRKLGFLIHATVFVLVNLALLGAKLVTGIHGRVWAIWPMLGWGLGLAIHALLAFGPVEAVHRRLLERELERDRDSR